MRNFQYELLTNDLVIEKYKQLTFELTERVRGGGGVNLKQSHAYLQSLDKHGLW